MPPSLPVFHAGDMGKTLAGCGLGAEDEVRVRHDLRSLEPGVPILKVSLLEAQFTCVQSRIAGCCL